MALPVEVLACPKSGAQAHKAEPSLESLLEPSLLSTRLGTYVRADSGFYPALYIGAFAIGNRRRSQRHQLRLSALTWQALAARAEVRPALGDNDAS